LRRHTLIYTSKEMARKTKTKAKRTTSEKEIRLFAKPSDWQAWLAANHRCSQGEWLRLGKKGSGLRSVTYVEALEVALCYGWIDGQKLGESEQAWLQRFLPRSARSIWSRINREKAQALIATGRMQPAGHAAIEVANKNGNWEAAYESSKAATVPPDFQVALDASPQARDFFDSLDRANRYAILFRIRTVKKPETRARKIQEFIQMLTRQERIHQPRRLRK
jgi:uncharacterized protein YdeI (YjbR/CyaY-like superfamily)